jgi:NADH dehydrogenase/NADH:ubiquinone oxidoreductase subunit G
MSPFELRGWDLIKADHVDPTDGFGTVVSVYIKGDQIILIEPTSRHQTLGPWITDKSRQFFDGLFCSWVQDLNSLKNNYKSNFWYEVFATTLETIYISDHCANQKSKKRFSTIIFENISLEILSTLTLFSQAYSFIKLRRSENYDLDNSLEETYHLSTISNKINLSNRDLCMLISTNPRNEGYYLNLSLRQRFLKGGFKCLTVGSLVNLTFPSTILGSNSRLLKFTKEGNSLICQDLKASKNPLIIFNSELFKGGSGYNKLQLFKKLKTLLPGSSLSSLSASLYENGTYAAAKLDTLTLKDLNYFSLLYFINMPTNNSANFKRITELKILNYTRETKENKIRRIALLDQKYKQNDLSLVRWLLNNNCCDKLNKYKRIPVSTFYEKDETFVDTTGIIKRTTKLISKSQTRNSWQILRKFINHLKKNLSLLVAKSSFSVIFNCHRSAIFKNYVNFHHFAVQSLTNLNFYLLNKTVPSSFNSGNHAFKSLLTKVKCVKIKYWLDDFFTGGKDEYSQNSITLTNCSKTLRYEVTNFT